MVALPVTITTPFSVFCTAIHSFVTGDVNLESSNFVHGSAMRSLSFAMSECSPSGRGRGHVSNFYIVDLENFPTARRRYAGDIHKSSVAGLFMIPIGQWKRLDRVTVECTCLLHIGPL